MDFKISYDSGELISECKEDIEEFGRDYPAFAVFQTYKSHSLLVNYLIGSEPPTVAELEGEERLAGAHWAKS